jgi:hypothetical protein
LSDVSAQIVARELNISSDMDDTECAIMILNLEKLLSLLVTETGRVNGVLKKPTY